MDSWIHIIFCCPFHDQAPPVQTLHPHAVGTLYTLAYVDPSVHWSVTLRVTVFCGWQQLQLLSKPRISVVYLARD